MKITGKKYVLLTALLLASCAIYPAFKRLRVQFDRADIAIQGPIIMADGIGRQTIELALVLAKKHKVQIKHRHFNGIDLPSAAKEILKRKFKKPARVFIAQEPLWNPGDSIDRFFRDGVDTDQIRYAYSMLESTRILPEWTMMLNIYFDAVIVPDPFLIEAYQNSGVTIPIFCIPLGIEIDDFLNSPLKEAKTKGPMIFACLGSGSERKNHILAIQAFAKALGNNDNAALYINCRQADKEVRENIINEINIQNCSNIKYTEVCLRKDAYLKFFRSVDCLLSFSKGEGFAIQPREAMALGIPVIVSNNTAQSTISKTSLVKSVSSTIPEPKYYYGRTLQDGEHYNCDVDECADAILDVYQNYSKYLSQGPSMRKWASNYNYKSLMARYESLVNPMEIVLGDVNEVTDNRITTTSPELYNKYMKMKKTSQRGLLSNFF